MNDEELKRLEETSKKLQFFDAMIGTNYPGDSANKAERDFFEWASINADTISDDIDHILDHVRELEARYKRLEEAARKSSGICCKHQLKPCLGPIGAECERKPICDALAALEGI